MKQLVNFRIVKCGKSKYKINCYREGLGRNTESYSYYLEKVQLAYINYVAMPNYYEVTLRVNTDKPLYHKSQKCVKSYSLPEACKEAEKFIEEYIQNIERSYKIMQTILENLEETYLQLEQLLEDDKKNLINLDTAGREEAFIALENTIKNIVLLLINDTADVVPQDSRVYNSLVNTPTYLNLYSAWQDDVMDKLYKHGIFHKEITVGKLIEELQKFAPNLNVNLKVDKTVNKVIVDDTGVNCITLVGVEQ